MSSTFPKEGIFAALSIPTDSRGRVLKRALGLHLAWLRSRGVHGVLALGSTGEFPRFSPEQRKRILETVAELAAPMTVLANISDIRAEVCSDLGRFAKSLGLPGVALMPPSFYPVSPQDQLAFFLQVAEAADLPVMLYNFPELTGNRISLETISAFADKARMGGIKQSGAEFSYHKDLVSLGREKHFAVFSGADTRLNEVFALGAAGCIGGLVNFVPEYMLEIFQKCHGGATGDCSLAVARMKEVGAVIDRLTFPLNVAAGMQARGFTPGVPKTAVSEQSRSILAGMTAELAEKFKSWGLPPAKA
jgi:4-hydroxy-tetrahydrodipicolinate synthase